MKFINVILFFFIAAFTIHNAQQRSLSGKIINAIDSEPLSYANIRIKNTSLGTSANIDGIFEIKLSTGNYALIASFMGFNSDTLNIVLNEDKEVMIKLKPSVLDLPEVTVLPGENPALKIIRKAVEKKNDRQNDLDSYIFRAYTKGIIKTTQDISTGDRSVSLDLNLKKDTADLKITGIIENESIGYFKKPDQYKDEIVARKQSANAPPTINILTGGRLIQNFYNDDIRFFNRRLINPISEDGLDFYFYYIEEVVSIDKYRVYKIFFEPLDVLDPGFKGRVYIIDSLYILSKIDVELNESANPGGIFSKVNIQQQFVPYENNIYMPIDYRLFVEGNFLGIAKFGFEINSIFYDYSINSTIDDNKFGMSVLKVLPDADKKDSLYWKTTQTIPNTIEELQAYRRIDSLESIPIGFWDRFSFLSTRISLNDHFSFSGPLSLYHFNRVEGHTIDIGFFLDDAFDKRLESEMLFNYGFSDNKFKSSLKSYYLLGDYRTTKVSFSVFNKLEQLFEDSDYYGDLTATALSLFTKYEFRDYFYTKGFSAGINADIFPVLSLGLLFKNKTDNTAINNSNFSFLKKEAKFKLNPPIYETRLNLLDIELSFDMRRFIEDGYYRRRISDGESFALLKGGVTISNKELFSSSIDFTVYDISINGILYLFGNTQMRYNLEYVKGNNAIPYQMLYSLPGNLAGIGKDYSFRTLNIGEVFGDEVLFFAFEHNLGDELFRFLNLPIIKNARLIFGTHLSIGYTTLSQDSKSILPVSYTEFKKPFYEAGFSVGHQLIPIKLEFTWKLNYTGKNNFVFGANAFIF